MFLIDLEEDEEGGDASSEGEVRRVSRPGPGVQADTAEPGSRQLLECSPCEPPQLWINIHENAVAFRHSRDTKDRAEDVNSTPYVSKINRDEPR